jgi:UDP-N-acetylmuramyl pentapeptide phosphotransferase/UDP-N-acetylglucosamine-1-phosphate transferase
VIVLALTALTSFLLTLLLIYVSDRFKFRATLHSQHLQAIHHNHTPRLGGISICTAFGIGILFIYIFRNSNQSLSFWLLIACLPAFFIGLIEDITAKIRAKHRLLIILFSAVLLIYFFKINSLNFGLSLLDQIMNQSIYHFPLLIWLFIVFSVTGLTNAFNIIDGLNGLSSSVAIFSACAITYVALKVNDLEIFYCALILIGVITGFIFWNYPKGMVFLGDGGAYFIGFMIASLSVLIIVRHQ